MFLMIAGGLLHIYYKPPLCPKLIAACPKVLSLARFYFQWSMICVNAPRFLLFILFADDTNLVASHHAHANFDILISLANSELGQIANWFIANELITNNS